MEDEEMLETTNETENVETETTEEIQETNAEAEVTEKKLELTQKQLNDMIADRVRRSENASKRKENSLRQEYEEKFANIENIINAGFGTSSLDEGLDKISDLCKEKGINIPTRATAQSQNDLEILSSYEVNEIVKDGYEAVDSELKRLAAKGLDRMNNKEKLIFSKLNNEKKIMDNEKELEALGAKKEILSSQEFKEFADKFAGSKFSMKEVYKMYANNNEPKPKAKPVGSMVNPNPKVQKDFITEEEYDRMSEKEIEENLDLIRKSMSRW